VRLVGAREPGSALNEFPGPAKIDVSMFDALWPFAQRAQATLDVCWSSVEEISQHVLKVGSITGPEIESIVAPGYQSQRIGSVRSDMRGVVSLAQMELGHC
jgi:hypothetical protein